MRRKMKTVIQVWTKHKNKIVEGVVISLITAWAVVSMFVGTYNQISNQTYPAQTNVAVRIMLILAVAVLIGILYRFHDDIARILMFAFIFVYMILCAVKGYDMDWESMGYQVGVWNHLGNVMLTIILSFFAVLAFLYVREDIFQLFRRLKLSRRGMYICALLVMIFTIAMVGIATVSRYAAYTNSTFDFGIFAQMYEYMKQTGLPNTTVERNVLISHFAVHFSPIFYLTLPIYYIFPSPVTVQLIQAAMIALPIIPIVLLGKKYQLSNWMIVGLTLIYALYPATMSGSLYDIHENCFLTFMVLLTIWFIEKNNHIGLAVSALLTCMVKEDATIMILVLGLYFIFSKRAVIRGALMSGGALVYYAVAQFIISGYGISDFIVRFNNLFYDTGKGGLFQIVYAILSNPAYALSQIVNNGNTQMLEKVEYLLVMIVPIAVLLFMVKKNYSRLILLIPFLLFNLITTYMYLHMIHFQYNFGSIALIMYIIIMNVKGMEVKRAKTLVGISLICVGIMFAGTVLPSTMKYYGQYKSTVTRNQKYDAALNLIPKQASVTASGVLVPHLSKVLTLYDISNINEQDRAKILGEGVSTELPETDFIVVTASDFQNENLTKLLNTGKYENIYEEENTIIVYQKVTA